MTNTSTTRNLNGIAAEKFVEDMTTPAYQEYQKNGADAANVHRNLYKR